MAKRIHANGQACVQARIIFQGAVKCIKKIIFSVIYLAEKGRLETNQIPLYV
ncbi:MAG: hypothetical protein Q7U53_03740 [Anaerolineaceae bacterium]|nr:hypothetical protein [Anaerolineaceae bacterium]